MTLVPIIVGIIGTVSGNMVKRRDDLEIRGTMRTIQTTALIKLAKIL